MDWDILCEKMQPKFAEGTFHHNRFKNMIKAMYISKTLITDEIYEKRQQLKDLKNYFNKVDIQRIIAE